MNKFVDSELKRLKEDFTEATGRPFDHFFCPIMFRDEKTKLCRAHIINDAFDNSARDCTVQRSDVDSFYGSRFEADFVDTANYKKLSLAEILTDSAMAKRFNAKVLLDGQPVDYFYTKGVAAASCGEIKPGSFALRDPGSVLLVLDFISQPASR